MSLMTRVDAAQQAIGDILISAQLSGTGQFSHVASPQNAGKDTLVFCSTETDFLAPYEKGARFFCVANKLESQIKKFSADCDVLYVSNVTLALARVQSQLFPEVVELVAENKHPSAIIHQTAEIGENVKIGPY